MNVKIKIIGGLLIVAAVILLYPGVLAYLESIHGDLGNLDVMETYVPWIFHLLLLLVISVIGFCWLGLWILMVMEPEQQPLSDEELVQQAERDRMKAKPLTAAPGAARKQDPVTEAAAQKVELPGITQMEEDPGVSVRKEPEPQVVVVNVAEKKAEDEAPESWKNDEEWDE